MERSEPILRQKLPHAVQRLLLVVILRSEVMHNVVRDGENLDVGILCQHSEEFGRAFGVVELIHRCTAHRTAQVSQVVLIVIQESIRGRQFALC